MNTKAILRDLGVSPSTWNAALVGLALAGIFSWIISFPLYSPLLAALLAENYIYIGHVYNFSHGVTLLFLWLCRPQAITRPPFIRVVGAAACLSFLVIVYMPLSLTALFVLMSFLGISTAYLVISWVPLFVNQRNPVLCMAVAIIAPNIVSPLVDLALKVDILLHFAVAMLVLLLFAGSIGVADLKARAHLMESIGGEASLLEVVSRKKDALLAMLGLGVLVLASYAVGGRIYQEVLPRAGELFPFLFQWLSLTSIVATFLFYLYIRRGEIPFLAIISLSILGVGLAVSLLEPFSYSAALFSSIILVAGISGMDLFYWLLLWSFASIFGAYRTFSIGLGVNVLIILGSSLVINADAEVKTVTIIAAIMLVFLAIPFAVQSITIFIKPDILLPEKDNDNIQFRPSKTDLWPKLTPTEKKVFVLLSEGCIYAEIAEKMYISKNTVKFHVRNILRKAEAKNRQELFAKLVK